MKERRRFVRVKYDEPVRIKNLTPMGPSQAQGALARDVSENGLRFVTDQFLPLDSRLMVEMNFLPSHQAVKVIAKPAWIREIANQERFEVGNYFLEIADEDRHVIRNYVGLMTGAFLTSDL